MRTYSVWLDAARFMLMVIGLTLPGMTEATGTVVENLEIDQVWSGHPVGFWLMTAGQRGDLRIHPRTAD